MASAASSNASDLFSEAASGLHVVGNAVGGEGASSDRPRRRHDLEMFFVVRNARIITLQDGSDGEEGGEDEDDTCLRDLWVGGGKILAITPADDASPPSASTPDANDGGVALGQFPPGILKQIDATGLTVIPGFVDVHVHASGGGGELGFPSRTPEATLPDLLHGGVTTFASTLGTDSVARTMEGLLGKTRSLSGSDTGLTGMAWLGGYSFPIENTVTGSVRRDVTLVPDLVGVGELAVSDHRGSQPSAEELTRLASEVRVAGMVAGKAGVTYCHMGDAEEGLGPLRDVVRRNARLREYVVPTHVERSPTLVEEGMEWMQSGGRADFAGWPELQRRAVRKYREDGQEAIIRDRLSISSDSYGSVPEFDEHGNVIKYGCGRPSVLLKTFAALVYEDGVPIRTALRFFCRNPATVIRMDGPPRHKGTIRAGGDADFLVLKLPQLPLPEGYPRSSEFGMLWPSTYGMLQYVVAGGCVYQCSSAHPD